MIIDSDEMGALKMLVININILSINFVLKKKSKEFGNMVFKYYILKP